MLGTFHKQATTRTTTFYLSCLFLVLIVINGLQSSVNCNENEEYQQIISPLSSSSSPLSSSSLTSSQSSLVSTSPSTTTSTIHQLIDWMRQYGAFIHEDISIERVSVFKGGRGIVARNDIPERTIVLSIPFNITKRNPMTNKETLPETERNHSDLKSSLDGSSLFIHEETVANEFKKYFSHSILQKLELIYEQQPTNLMALFLLFEKYFLREKSPWNPYLCNLPEDFSTTALFFTETDLKELDGTSLSKYASSRQNAAQIFFSETVEPLLNEMKQEWNNSSILVTVDHFKWALAVIWSRTHGVFFPSFNTSIPCLVPFGDMFNFDPNFNIRSKTLIKEQVFAYEATRSIKKGEQLFVPYSNNALPNFQLMMDYGFCQNISIKNDYLIVDVSAIVQQYLKRDAHSMSDDELSFRGMKIQVLQEIQLFGYPTQFKLNLIRVNLRTISSLPDVFHILGPDLSLLLRIAVSNRNELSSFVKNRDMMHSYKYQMISLRNDRLVMDEIENVIRAQYLNQLSETLYNDRLQIIELENKINKCDISQDSEECSESNISEWIKKRCSAVLRRTEKHIIRALLKLIKIKRSKPNK